MLQAQKTDLNKQFFLVLKFVQALFVAAFDYAYLAAAAAMAFVVPLWSRVKKDDFTKIQHHCASPSGYEKIQHH